MATVLNADPSIAPGPWRPGPVTLSRQRRTFAFYGGIILLGLLPLLLDASPAWQAFGMGLWLPGAGFLATGGPWIILLPLTLLLFAVAVFAWFGAGAIVAPVIVWLGSAALAGLFTGHAIWQPSPYLAAALTALTLGWLQLRAHRKKAADIAMGKQRAAIMPMAVEQARARVAANPRPEVRELDDDQLGMMRYLLDRGLQPIDGFQGFDKRDQFQTASWRYQVNWLGSDLATAQTFYTPSFHGYLSLAQRNLVEKFLDRRVWDYWVLESSWGHLNFTDWNPAAKDNIMLTGYYGGQVLLYMSATGDMRYAKPASLTFRLNGRKAWAHDIHSICRSIYDNFKRSAYCLYPCEPNWIYPGCNFYGMRTLVAYDRLFGTRYVEEVAEPWLDALAREFTSPAGTITPLRSSLTGFAFPFPGSDLGLATIANIFAPDLAMRMWAPISLGMRRMFHEQDGRTIIAMPDKSIDFGNYRKGARTFGMGALMMAANEFGDIELAEAARNTLDALSERTERNGVLYYRKGSNMANCSIAQGLLVRTGDFRDLYAKGPDPRALTGPILGEAAYPDVLVARAVSDGEDLDLIVAPGAAGGSTQRLGFERLKPGRRYHLSGSVDTELTADPQGKAMLDVALAGRTRLHLSPMA
ncbi:hypothetical protein SAMN02927924_03071 [Sphingobium faniae]|nr:hypothetical protein SAMN02927924_03071 [Sphingobium faniae]